MSAYAAALQAPAARFGDTVTDYLSGHAWTHTPNHQSCRPCPTCGGGLTVHEDGIRVSAGPGKPWRTVHETHLRTSGLRTGTCPTVIEERK